MNTQRPQQHGYVLLLALVMVGLVSAGTVGLTRASLASATEAKRAESDLQRRWAEISCRRVLLEQGPRLIEQRFEATIEPEAAEPVSVYIDLDRRGTRTLTQRLKLGGFTLDLRLADEQAKLNVNMLLAEHGPEEATRRVDTLLAATGAMGGHGLRAALKPLKDADRGIDRVGTLERVFEGFEPGRMLSEAYTRSVDTPVDAVTCWGDGRLRLALASDDALRALLDTSLDATRLERLIELRNEHPDITVDQALRAVSLGSSQAAPVRSKLTDRSECYSLWITARSERRTWHSLTIVELNGSSEQRQLTYLW